MTLESFDSLHALQWLLQSAQRFSTEDLAVEEMDSGEIFRYLVCETAGKIFKADACFWLDKNEDWIWKNPYKAFDLIPLAQSIRDHWAVIDRPFFITRPCKDEDTLGENSWLLPVCRMLQKQNIISWSCLPLTETDILFVCFRYSSDFSSALTLALKKYVEVISALLHGLNDLHCDLSPKNNFKEELVSLSEKLLDVLEKNGWLQKSHLTVDPGQ